MLDRLNLEPLFFAPFVSSVMTVEPEDAGVLGRCLVVARRLGEMKGFGERGYRIVVNSGVAIQAGSTAPTEPFAASLSARGMATCAATSAL